MRAAPKLEPASRARTPDWNLETKVVLITRLFGGGARAREVDKVSWLRSSAAKSALRFWWRSSHAHQFSSLDALLAKESELFGAPATFDAEGHIHGGPGAFRLTSQCHLASAPVEYNEAIGNPLNYALFPAQGMGQARAKIAAPSDQTWAVLRLAADKIDSETQEALLSSLRLWLTLGGAGSRNRRGAGALGAETREEAAKLGLPLSLEQLKGFLQQHCNPRALSPSLAAVFALARTRRVCVGPLQATGEEAQKRLLSVLREARQDRPHQPGGPWGRSRWPEADAIRIKADPSKKWAHAPNPANAGRYPRSVLGLPIVVHFKTPPFEPSDHHILGALREGMEWRKLERYSSPILLRPVRVWEGNRAQYAPVAVFTECTLPDATQSLVTTEPQASVNPADVVSYRPLSEAQATLSRIERAFGNALGFHFL